MSTAPSARPVVEGLFVLDGDGAALIGSRCPGCEARYFPHTAFCRDPACGDRATERVALPRRGRLYSHTVQRYRPPPLFAVEPWEPYAIALVDLGHGLRVMGMVAGAADQPLRIGMAIRVVVEPLRTDDAGEAVLTYKFAPDPEAGGAA